MSCVSVEELALLINRQLTGDRVNEVEEHLRGCLDCRQKRQTLLAIEGCLSVHPKDFVDPVFARDILEKARELRPPQEERDSWSSLLGWAGPRWVLWPVAAAALLVLALILVPGKPTAPAAGGGGGLPDGVQSRGSGDDASDAWVSFAVFRSNAGQNVPVDGRIRADDFLAFSYENRRAEAGLGFLMIFAVDGRGSVFWYYPAHPVEGENPCGMPIQVTASPQALSDKVRHPLGPGPLRLWALFSRTRLCVAEVEARVRGDLARVGFERLLRLGVADTAQPSTLLEVVK